MERGHVRRPDDAPDGKRSAKLRWIVEAMVAVLMISQMRKLKSLRLSGVTFGASCEERASSCRLCAYEIGLTEVS
jgi:hypothetical protein